MKLYTLISHCCVYREADESRLREVCESFLGPPTGMGTASLDLNMAWDPCVLVRRSTFLITFDFIVEN